MDGTLTVLRKCRLFQDLSPEVLQREVLPRGRTRTFARGAVLIEPGDQVDQFAVILRGKVHISQIFSDGTRSLMDALRPSYPVGADLICTRSRRSHYYDVAGTDTAVIQFRRELLLEEGWLP